MAAPLLRTKLYIPPARTEWVSRPALIERLQAGLDRRLTLISAPAGFGKTTLLSQCVAHCGPEVHVAWLSLDREDNDPARFWRYVVAALQAAVQTIRPELGQAALAALQTTPTAPIEDVLVGLINDLAACGSHRLVLILDDLHLITEPRIHQGLAFLLDNLPPATGSLGGLHLVIASRADLPWPIARLRARGELNELRPVDLRFTPEQAAAFLNDAAGLGLAPEQVAALDARTEGWIAGLQMAALAIQAYSLREREQARAAHSLSTYIQTLTAGQRFILDYLVEEVLDQQPPDIQAFLLQTSILDQMTASLCDAVRFGAAKESPSRSGGTDGPQSSAALLRLIERANLFTIPLDDERRWYRYHHLFADLLRRRLERGGRDRVAALHLRASEWYEANGLIAAAIGHALRAEDVERVARLARRNALAMMDYDELATVVRWLDTLSEEALRSRPWLGIACAWAHFYMGHLDAVESQIRAIEGQTDEPDLAGNIAAIRCYTAAVRGEMSLAAQIAEEALRLLPESDQAMRGFVVALQSTILRWRGDLRAAARAAVEAVALSRAAQDSRVLMEALVIHGALLHTQGRLCDTFALCQEALLLADQSARLQGRPSPVVASVHRLAGRILYEWNDLHGALRHLRLGIELSQEWGGVEDTAFAYFDLSRVLQAMGDARGALDAVQEGRQQAGRFSFWFGSYGAAQQARLGLLQGNLAAAAQWAQESGLCPDDAPGFQYILEYTVLARVLTAQGRPDRALPLLDRLLVLVERAGAGLPVIEILLLQAVALQEQGCQERARTALARALERAEPEGFVRTFVDKGAPVRALLREAARAGIAEDYALQLLEALDGPPQAVHAEPLPQPLVEPLSARELEVLRFLDTHLSAPQIAEELVLSRHTVRTHVKHIYEKLGTHNRADAVQRARELGLL